MAIVSHLHQLFNAVELPSHIDHCVPRCEIEVIRRKSEIAQCTELKGKTQAGVVLALLVDDGSLR
jgi:hypothetical protein